MVGRCVVKGVVGGGGCCDRLSPDVKDMACSEKYFGLYFMGWVEEVVPKDGGCGPPRRSNIMVQICVLERWPCEECVQWTRAVSRWEDESQRGSLRI